MLQSQKLQIIENLLSCNKEKEISFQKNESFETKDILSDKYFKLIKDKYIWFDILKWCIIRNFLQWRIAPIRKTLYILFPINLYKKSWFSSYFWNSIENKIEIITVFKVQNWKEFIESFLDFIDEEKQNHILYDERESKDTLLKELESAKSKFSNTEFTLHYSLRDFIWRPVKIYSLLKNLRDVYEIKNIQIFNGNINFYIAQIGEENIKIEFNGEDIFINNKKIYFQDKQSFIKDYMRLLFSYFKATKKNEVSFLELKKIYERNIHLYPKVGRNKFSYDDVRIDLRVKSEEISKKYNIKWNFFETNSKSISSPFYIPEEDTLFLSSLI